MEKKENKTTDSIVDELLKEVPTETEITIELPSKCKCYSHKGPVNLKPMRLGDELAIAGAKKGSTSPVDVLLGRLLPGINPDELLIVDKIYIMLKIREISSGELIQSTIACQHCETINTIAIKIPDLPVNHLPDDFTDPRKITLPICKRELTIRSPRSRDEAYLANQEVILRNLWRFVSKVEDYTDAKIIEAFLSRLKNKDYTYLIKELLLLDYGIETTVKFKCSEPKCGKVNTTRLPLGTDFLAEN